MVEIFVRGNVFKKVNVKTIVYAMYEIPKEIEKNDADLFVIF